MDKDSQSILNVFRAGSCVLSFAEGLSRSELEADTMRRSAILYQIEAVRSAAMRLPKHLREHCSEVPWQDIDEKWDVVHQYDLIDFDIVWQAIQRNIPEIIGMIAPLLPEESTDAG
jgi:uncharacterized protein with HEPN domain